MGHTQLMMLSGKRKALLHVPLAMWNLLPWRAGTTPQISCNSVGGDQLLHYSRAEDEVPYSYQNTLVTVTTVIARAGS